jgi:Fe-S cluster assembly protein SufD
MSATETAEPQFLAERRAKGADAAASLPIPAFRGVPGWEFTPIDDLDLDGWTAAPGGDVAEVAEPLFALDGAATPDAAEATSEGPVVLPLAVAAERHPDLVAEHLGSVVHDSIITARNDALWTDGAFVYVPRGVTVDTPILLTHVHAQAGTSLYTRTLVVLEEGAEAEVWDQTLSGDGVEEGLVNGVVELVVGANARLRYVGAQDLSEKTWVFGAQRATIARDASLDWITLGFGSGNGKVFLETELTGPGGHAKVTGAYATEGRQHLDFDTLQTHAAANCVSDLAFRGILAGRSSAVWHDQGGGGRAADRRLPGVAQPAAGQEGPRGRDPRPGDPRQRRALHARGGDRPDRPGAGLLPARPRPRRAVGEPPGHRGLPPGARRALRGRAAARRGRRGAGAPPRPRARLTITARSG